MTLFETAHESWLTRVTVLESLPPPLPEPDDPHADSVTMPSPTTTAANCLPVMLNWIPPGVTRKRRGPARDLSAVPGQGATARVKTELPTQNDLGEVQRVCGLYRTLSAVALPCRNM